MTSEQLIHKYSKMINGVAWKLGSDHNFDDLVQEGTIGLLKAAEKDDGIKDFDGYAYTYIRYAMLDFLGKNNRFSASKKINQKAARVRKTCRQLEERGKPVSVEAVSEITELSEEEVIDYWEFFSLVPLDYVIPEVGPLIEVIPTPDGGIEKAERRIWLEQIFQILSDKQRTVLEGYLAGHTNGEIAQFMGLSAEQVKYVKRDAIKRLSKHVADEELGVFLA